MLLRGFRRSKKLGSLLLLSVDVAAWSSWCIGQPAGGEASEADDAATGGCLSGNDALDGVDVVLPMVH